MKRLSTLLCALLLLVSLSPAAHADVLFEPDNNFYDSHAEECTYVGRSYYANGADGYITLWNAPDGHIAAAQYKNTSMLHVYWQYKDWGFASAWNNGQGSEGWVPMSDLVLCYDHISFAEEYTEQITDYNGEFAEYAGSPSVINFYRYPGSPSLVRAMSTEDDNVMTCLTGSDGDPQSSYISAIFVDENGLTWGYVAYLYGRLNAWFCLDAPDGSDFPLRKVGTAVQSAEGETTLPIAENVELIPAQSPRLPARSLLPYALVACVTVVTAGLLIWLYRRTKKTMHK